MSNESSKVTNIDSDPDRQAELTMLIQMEKCESRQERKAFAKYIGISWGEYQHLKHKYSRVIARWKELDNEHYDIPKGPEGIPQDESQDRTK